MLRSSRARLALGLLLPATILACGDATPAPVVAPPPTASASAAPAPTEAAYVEPPDSPLPTLATGALDPIDHKEIAHGKAVARHLGDAFETIGVEIEIPGEVDTWGDDLARAVVAIDGAPGEARPYAFISPPSYGQRSGDRPMAIIWARRPKDRAGKPLEGDVFTASTYDRPGHHFRFQLDAAASAKAKSDPAALQQWAQELGINLHGWQRAPGAFHQFAAARLKEVFGRPEPKRPKGGLRPLPPPRIRESDIARLMETTTGVASIQEALQSDRGLFIAAAREKPKLPLDKVEAPKLKSHPWAEMLKALGATAAVEPLAAAAPADFWYARCDSLTVLLDLLAQADRWGTPAANTLDRSAEDRALAARYEAELGLSRGPLTQALGPEVVTDLALVGSDPYVREGTDVTFIFRVKSKSLFDAALAASLASHGAAHGAVTQSQSSHGGADIKIARSADGAVHQHRASAGGFEIVSNSLGAVSRVIDAIAGKRPRLADEPDFRYMLARDAGKKASILAYLGDRFVAEVTGPAQKILEARREIALAELSTPGFAALLHGYITGRSPKDVDELVASKLLAKADLVHANGAPIAWKPGEAARSSFGTPAAMTPLIDLPPVTTVTETEKQGYEMFARSYEGYWSTYIDPVAIRFSLDPEGTKDRSMSADLRILPLIDSTEYRDLKREAGDAHFHADPLDTGARMITAIGQDSKLRRELGSFARNVPGLRDFKLDWLGDWAMIGMADRNAAASAALHLVHEEIELPGQRESRGRRDRDIIDAIASLPLYIGVGVKSTGGVAIALTALHKLADDTAPGMLSWGPYATHRGVPIVRVMVKGGAFFTTGDLAVYYALAEGALLISLNEGVLRRVIDARALGKGPASVDPDAPQGNGSAPQFSLDLGGAKGSGILTGLGWLLETAALDGAGRSRSSAEAILRGAPDRAGDPKAARDLALAYLGAAPLTPSGGAYSLSKEGVRDPIRGTPYAPIFPAVPAAGSPVERLLGALARFRGEISFDDEGKPAKGRPSPQSLHARVKVDLREQ